MGKNIDPGPKGQRFKPRLAPHSRMISARNRTARRDAEGERGAKNLVTLLDLCVSSLRRGHANLLCIVPILSDDLRGESESSQRPCKHTQVTIPCIPVRRRRAGAWEARSRPRLRQAAVLSVCCCRPRPPPPAMASVVIPQLRRHPAWRPALHRDKTRCRRGIIMPACSWHTAKTW